MRSLPRRFYEWMLRLIGLLNIYLRPRFRGMARYARYCAQDLPLQDKTVFFEVYRAEKISDTPYAMFKAMLDDPYYRDFTFVWACNDVKNPYRTQYASRRNVKFCAIHDRTYTKTLATAKYLVSNKTWPFYFAKRPGQVSVTTWHATAFKHLGKDQGGTVGQFKNLTRNFLHADYLVMPNRFTSEVMLRSNDVEGIFPGVVLEEGYPRIDLTLQTTEADARAMLQRVSGADPRKKVVLYAPTWRGETGGYLDTTDLVMRHVREMRAGLPDDYELVLKVHDLTYRHLAARSDLGAVRYVPDWVDTNELLPAVDVLVTDYSSIFFDFLVLDRPVVFFAYDLEEYIESRGLYFDMRELPGPLCYHPSEVVDAVLSAQDAAAVYAPVYSAMREQYCGADDGHASSRVCDIVFKGVAPTRAYRSFDEEKYRILVGGCTFDHTDETFELIAFSRQLDYDAYDLSVLYTGVLNPGRERLLRSLDPRARVFYSPGKQTMTPSEYWRLDAHKRLSAAQRCAPAEVERMSPFFEREKYRLTGEVHFDLAMCFTDRINVGTYLMSVCDFDRRVMWLADSTADQSQCLPAEYARSRFETILHTPRVEGSRFVRAVRKLDKKQRAEGGDASAVASVLRPVERMVDFDGSIAIMREEEERQAQQRVSAAVRRWVDAGCGSDGYAQTERLANLVDRQIAAAMDAVSADVAVGERARGFDHAHHNEAVIEQFYAAIGRPQPGSTRAEER